MYLLYKEWEEKFLGGRDKSDLTKVEKGGTINDIVKETFGNVADEIMNRIDKIVDTKSDDIIIKVNEFKEFATEKNK